ncbi:MAG: hypothetical protein SVU88_03440 [Candidatus Nanohaloarchaea archaeon]|nr:hypothetical protein [Candidatus Nanohaloarchaea archaeon]
MKVSLSIERVDPDERPEDAEDIKMGQEKQFDTEEVDQLSAYYSLRFDDYLEYIEDKRWTRPLSSVLRTVYYNLKRRNPWVLRIDVAAEEVS